MRLELVSIETDTEPLDGLFYEPEGGATNGAVLIMHGNCGNFYTGLSRVLPPLLAAQGFACLAYNRRGHDIVTHAGAQPGGAAFQRVAEMIEDNRRAAAWLARRGHDKPVVIGHSNGGMLGVRHAADDPSVRALVLLSAHCGGKGIFPAISKAGMMAGSAFDETSARARALVAEGKGRDLMLVPGWWWAISAETFVDYLDICPDILALAPDIRCPVMFLRGDKEPRAIYPGEDFVARAGGPAEFHLVADCDHSYRGHERAVIGRTLDWLRRSGIEPRR